MVTATSFAAWASSRAPRHADASQPFLVAGVPGMVLGQRAVDGTVYIVVVAVDNARAGSGSGGDRALGDRRQVLGLVGPAQRLRVVWVGPVHVWGAGALEYHACPGARLSRGVDILDIGGDQLDALWHLAATTTVDAADEAASFDEAPRNRRPHRSGDPDHDVQRYAHQSFWISSSSPVISQRMSENGMPPAARNSSTKSRSTKSGPS